MDALTRETERAQRMSMTTPAWAPGEPIPTQYTQDGGNVTPPVHIGNVPAEAQTVALLLEDLDAAEAPFTHWLVWNLPASTRQVPENADLASMGARLGRNDFGGVDYRGPRPPSGEEHRYLLRVFAVRGPLDLPNGVPRDQLVAALEGHVAAYGEHLGTYGGE